MSLPASDSAAMEKLHQYICQQAFDSSQKPSLPAGFIGPIPPPPSSSFIGQRWLKEDRPDTPNEPTVRVMFRCQPTPTSASRHVLLHLKPSVTEEALAKKLCEVFEIIQNGLVITKTMVKFQPDQCFLTEPNRVYSYAEVFERLSSTMAGFFEVTVVPTDRMNICTKCRERKATTPVMLRQIRQWCFGVNSLCGKCFRSGAVPDHVVETCLSDGRVLRRFRS